MIWRAVMWRMSKGIFQGADILQEYVAEISNYGKYLLFIVECDQNNIAQITMFCLFYIAYGLALSWIPSPSAHHITSLVYFLNIISVFGQYPY